MMGSSSSVNINGIKVEITDGVIRINDKKVVYVDGDPTVERRRPSASVFCYGMCAGLVLSIIVYAFF